MLFDTNDKDRIIAFSSDIELSILSKSKRWHIDGTFKCCPDLFNQVFTIHGWYQEHMYYAVTFLLIGKSTTIYVKALNNLIKSSSDLGFELNPNFIKSDYELNIINAFKTIYPSVEIKGCYFHFIQALWKNIKDKQLNKEYKADEENKKWFDQLKALAFLPPKYVITAFNYLISIAPNGLKMNPKFSQYLLRLQYMDSW